MQFELELSEAPRIRERVSSRVRSIRIEVRADASVALIYPRWVPRREALAFLHEREAWVTARLAEMRARAAEQDAVQPVRPPCWDGGDAIPLRGTLVPVLIEPARLRRATVRFDAGAIRIFVAPEQRTQAAVLERALRQALLHQARLEARRLLDEEAPRLGVSFSALQIADPRTQWGSCNAAGRLAFSWRLVMAPTEVFRYVVVHELCHRVHLDHSPSFWQLVERQMPDHAVHKQWLREQGERLHRILPPRRGA